MASTDPRRERILGIAGHAPKGGEGAGRLRKRKENCLGGRGCVFEPTAFDLEHRERSGGGGGWGVGGGGGCWNGKESSSWFRELVFYAIQKKVSIRALYRGGGEKLKQVKPRRKKVSFG